AQATREVARLAAARDAEAQAHREEVTALRDALELSQSELGLRYDYDALIHKSPAFRRVLGMLDKVTDNDLPVLVTGESGVGKELLARALHFNGPRRGARFVAENCGAIPPDLFESVFFGHVRGAFTGAHSARRGLLEMADGGTLFLDEVGELPLEHQVKLLRALQEKRFRPVGAQKELSADFRVVAATNRDLRRMVAEGSFREDLYYRIAVVTIEVPPLRERRDDVLPIVQRLLDDHGARSGRALKLTTGAADALLAYPWPGNVRELENELLRAAVLCEGTHIRAAHLSPRVLSASPQATGISPNGGDGGSVAVAEGETLADVLGRVEAQVLSTTLARTGGKKAPAARLLGLSRPGLDAKIERHGIDIERIKADAGPGGGGEGRG
ncbi:MAG: sigma-54-dependent Fis family transcriptional regulator, partial [Deltaproteobacteria bacterium]